MKEKTDYKPKIVCTLCGYRCTSTLSEKGGRLLQDQDTDLYINLEPIEDCRARYFILKGVPKGIARGVVIKGEMLT